MPLSYCFRDLSGKTVPRIEIEAMVCAMVGVEVHPVNDCMQFQIMEWTGLAAAVKNGRTDEGNVEAVLEKHKDKVDAESVQVKEVCRRFLYREYVLEAWR